MIVCFLFSRKINLSITDFHSIFDIKTCTRINTPENILIGKEVWVCNDVDFSKGTIISDNSIIAKKSLVNKKFTQQNIIYAGIPAKMVRENVEWRR